MRFSPDTLLLQEFMPAGSASTQKEMDSREVHWAMHAEEDDDEDLSWLDDTTDPVYLTAVNYSRRALKKGDQFHICYGSRTN